MPSRGGNLRLVSHAMLFIIRSLQKILRERDIKRSSLSALRESCEAALESLKANVTSEGEEISEGTSPALPVPRSPTRPPIVTLDQFIEPFVLALEAKSPRIVCTALDGLQKLIAYGHITGNEPDPKDKTKKAIDRIVEKVCACFVNSNTDEEVQLQVLKCLLTLLTASNVEVHEASLVLCIRTCYNVYLGSRVLVNQTTAKATLTQMMNVIFQRMEIKSGETWKVRPVGHRTPLVESGGVSSGETASLSSLPNGDVHASQGLAENGLNHSSSSPKTGRVSGAGDGSASCGSTNGVLPPSPPETTPSPLDSSPNSSTLGESDEVISEIVSDIICTAVTQASTKEGGVSLAPPHPVSTNHVTATPPPGSSLKSSTSTSSIATTGGKSTTSGTTVGAVEDTEDESPEFFVAHFNNVWEKDAFLVFRSLCKLAMRPLPEGHPDPRSHEHRSKVLSLQLLLGILQHAGPVFQSNEMFIVSIRQYLCVALSRNGVSPVAEVFELSLAIFLVLLSKFKMRLKMQIEVFFKDIFLHVLESSTSAFEHKWMVVQTLTRICADAQSVVDMYLNYDCDLQASNLLERLITDLSKIAQGRQALELGATPLQERSIRIKGVQCLVSLLKCMVEWSKDMYVTPHPQTNGAIPTEKPDGEPSLAPSSASASQMKTSKQPPDNPEEVEVLKAKKAIWEHGIALFKRKPMSGLKYLQDKGLLGRSPEDIAAFFHAESRLDRTILGDFLGDPEEFNRTVMYAYVDQLDFTDKEFVNALRLFLQGFRLPGEAQKIDRLMEKFASRYCECNSTLGIFASADTAYVLAYSIIMLTTDLHSPQVKNKMTKEQYIRMNRGINDSKDLPEQYLSDIYDEIAGNEIRMHPQSSGVKPEKRLVSDIKKRRLIYNDELESICATAKALMEAASHVDAPFTHATHAEHVKPMFVLAWSPCLAAFSVGLNDCEEEEMSLLCLEGIRCAIRIACIFRLETERDAYLRMLVRFTLLQASKDLKELKTKNFDAIKTLITVAQTDGNYLDSAWLHILQCISQLEFAQTGKYGLTASVIGSISQQNATSRPYVYEKGSARGGAIETPAQSVTVGVDRIFTGSVKLDGNAIGHFVKALCQVSTDEINSTPPRLYSLQKMVEISYYNMARIRLQWSRIWEVLGDHFNRVGCCTNEDVAFFALDSLRQLSMKFIEKGELPNFRFQKEFLRPFEVIIKRNHSPTIRDMTVRCLTQMVNSQAPKIKSGWKNIFGVFQVAASDSETSIQELAFQTMGKIVSETFTTHFDVLIDSFQDAVKCLSEFACNSHSIDSAMDAIKLIRDSARAVHDHSQLFQEYFPSEDAATVSEQDRAWVRGWFPIMFELSCVMSRCKLDVRTRALTVLFDVIKTYGAEFSPGWWKDLFQILFRIFDIMKVPEVKRGASQRQVEAEWMTTTCNHALYAMMDVFTEFFEVLSPILLADIFHQLQWCVLQDNEQLARSGTNCLENLVVSNGAKFSPEIWSATCECMYQIFTSTLPHELLTWSPPLGRTPPSPTPPSHSPTLPAAQPGKPPYAINSLLIRFIVQMELITCIDNIVFFPAASRKEDAQHLQEALAASSPVKNSDIKMAAPSSTPSSTSNNSGMYPYLSSSHLFRLAECLMESHKFARKFNSNHELRNALWKSGLRGNSKPNLARQETHSLACVTRILFRLLQDPQRRPEDKARAEILLVSLCSDALEYFLTLSNDSHREAWHPLLLLILSKTLRLSPEAFKRAASAYFPFLCDLVRMSDAKPDLRALLSKLLRRAGRVYGIHPRTSEGERRRRCSL